MLDKPVPIGFALAGLSFCGVVWLGFPLATDCLLSGQSVQHSFLLESLILAQDERWRRA